MPSPLRRRMNCHSVCRSSTSTPAALVRRARSPADGVPMPGQPEPAASFPPTNDAYWYRPWSSNRDFEVSRRSSHRCAGCQNSRIGSAASHAPKKMGRKPVPEALRQGAVVPRGNHQAHRTPALKACRKLGRTNPARQEINVVLPAPFGPSRPHLRPPRFPVRRHQARAGRKNP